MTLSFFIYFHHAAKIDRFTRIKYTGTIMTLIGWLINLKCSNKEYVNTAAIERNMIKYAIELKAITATERKEIIMNRGTSHLSNL